MIENRRQLEGQKDAQKDSAESSRLLLLLEAHSTLLSVISNRDLLRELNNKSPGLINDVRTQSAASTKKVLDLIKEIETASARNEEDKS
jgi:hypothetical protein